MSQAERFEDMSPRGRLRVSQQDDGDMIVAVVEDPDGTNGGVMVGVEFCTSGGKSPKTLAALRNLMQAMAEDNADRPHCSRRGERGLGVDEVAIQMKSIEQLAQAAHSAYLGSLLNKCIDLSHMALLEQKWSQLPKHDKDGWMAAVQEVRNQINEVHE